MPAKAKEKVEVGPPMTAEEAEAQALAGLPGEDANAEVKAEEFSRGIDKPVWESPLPENVVDELRKPLDPNRVRKRAGRGSSQFEYLAGHDVKRRANELFGFGNWSYEVLDHEEIAAIQVAKENGTLGWHIGYKANVMVHVRGCMPFSDFGYGDGVEYGPAAFVTARELALKESVTDAMKRAFTGWGDQFGLILYAKGDEKQRIDRERNVLEARPVANTHVPKSWVEVTEWAEPYGEELGWLVWVQEASMTLFGSEQSADLTSAQRASLLRKASGAVVALREAHDPSEMPPPTREEVQKAWATVLSGDVLEGPAWRLSPDEENREPFTLFTIDDGVIDPSDAVAPVTPGLGSGEESEAEYAATQQGPGEDGPDWPKPGEKE